MLLSEIAALIKHCGLKNCEFIPIDSKFVCIRVDNKGEIFFKHLGGDVKFSSFSREHQLEIEAQETEYILAQQYKDFT